MKVLVVSPRMPPLDGEFGGDRRLRLFIDGLARVFDEFSFLHLAPQASIAAASEEDLRAEKAWGVRGATTFAALARRRETFANHYVAGLFSARHVQSFFPFAGPACVAAVAAALAGAPDMVFAHELGAMLPVLAARPAAPVLFDMADLLSRTHWRTATAPPLRPGCIGYVLQTPAILAAERRAARMAAVTSVCTERDRAAVSGLGAGSRAVTVPNAVAIPAEAPGPAEGATLLFLGNYAYEPNVRAVERLVRRIWPMIRLARPDARLLLAGGCLERAPCVAELPGGVEALGFVDDLDALYARTRVVCCPIDVGGGTRLKLIEAAAYARPMVSTRMGAENLEFRDGREILLRDDDAGFAAACVELLGDAARAARLGAAARSRVRQRYQDAAVHAQVEALARAILAR